MKKNDTLKSHYPLSGSTWMTLCRAQRRGNSHIGPTIILWLEPVRPWQGHNRRVGVASGGSTNGRRAGAEPGHDRPMATSRRRLAHCQRRDDLLGQSNGPPEGRAWGQANYNFFFQEIFWELEKLRGIETVWSAGCFFLKFRSMQTTDPQSRTMKKRTTQFEWRASSARISEKCCAHEQLFFFGCNNCDSRRCTTHAARPPEPIITDLRFVISFFFSSVCCCCCCWGHGIQEMADDLSEISDGSSSDT